MLPAASPTKRYRFYGFADEAGVFKMNAEQKRLLPYGGEKTG